MPDVQRKSLSPYITRVIATHFEVPIVDIELYDADRKEMVFVGSTGINRPGNLE